MRLEIGKTYRRRGSTRPRQVGGKVVENDQWVHAAGDWYEQSTGKFLFESYADGMVTRYTLDKPNHRDLVEETSPDDFAGDEMSKVES